MDNQLTNEAKIEKLQNSNRNKTIALGLSLVTILALAFMFISVSDQNKNNSYITEQQLFADISKEINIPEMTFNTSTRFFESHDGDVLYLGADPSCQCSYIGNGVAIYKFKNVSFNSQYMLYDIGNQSIVTVYNASISKGLKILVKD